MPPIHYRLSPRPGRCQGRVRVDGSPARRVNRDRAPPACRRLKSVLIRASFGAPAVAS